MIQHISHSTARMICECQQKARFKLEGKRTKSPEVFMIGSAVHAGLETYANTESKEQAILATSEYVFTYGNSNKYRPDSPDQTADDYELDHTLQEISEQCVMIVSDVIDYPCEDWQELESRTEMISAEEALTIEIPIEIEDVRLENETDDEYYERITKIITVEGKPDLILADHKNKKLYIVDNKTAGKMTQMSVTEKLQISIYGLYYQMQEEYQGYEFIAVVRRILKDKRKKDLYIQSEVFQTTIIPEMMEIAKNHLVASYLQAEQIQGDMLTTYGGLLSGYGCSYCDFKDICEGYQAFNQKTEGEE